MRGQRVAVGAREVRDLRCALMLLALAMLCKLKCSLSLDYPPVGLVLSIIQDAHAANVQKKIGRERALGCESESERYLGTQRASRDTSLRHCCGSGYLLSFRYLAVVPALTASRACRMPQRWGDALRAANAETLSSSTHHCDLSRIIAPMVRRTPSVEMVMTEMALMELAPLTSPLNVIHR